MTAMLRSRGGLAHLRLLYLLAASAGILLFLKPAFSDVRGCDCPTSNLTAMEKMHECSLCVVADRQPAYLDVFFLKDSNPTKPNRLLALPRIHEPGSHPLSALSPELRHVLWSAAITKAQETWGSEWGIAYNGDEKRTQC